MTLQSLRWLPQIIFTPTQLFSVEPGPILFFSLLLPPSLMFPLCLLCFATSSVFISSLSLPSSYSNSLIFFSLSYLSILHQGLLFFSIRGKLIKCNLLNAQSRAYIVSPSTPRSILQSTSQPSPYTQRLLIHYALSIIMLLSVPPALSKGQPLPPTFLLILLSIYLVYTHTYTPLIPLPAPTSSLTPFHPTLPAPHMKHGTAPSFSPSPSLARQIHTLSTSLEYQR